MLYFFEKILFFKKMTSQITSNHFSYFLDSVKSNNKNLIIRQNRLASINESNSNVNNKIHNLLLFLELHKELTIGRLEEIKKKFSNEIENNQELANRIIYLYKKISHLKLQSHLNQTVKIEIQVMPSPRSMEEWLYNLSLAIEKYPKYQLGNDLGIYDATFSTSYEWDGELIRIRLKEKKEELLQKNENQQKEELRESLLNKIDYLLNIFKPHKIVHLCVTIEEKLEINRALFFDCETAIEEGKHLCMTKQFIQSHPKEFDDLLKNSDLYVQDHGNLMLAVPKGILPQDHGYVTHSSKEKAEDCLVPWLKKPSEIFASSNQGQNIAKDLKNLLAEDSSEQGYARFIYLTGHWEEGEIAGIKEPFIPDILQVLKNKKTLFAGISSCYLGNENYCMKLTNSTNEVPFPILFLGITHLPTLSKFPMFKVLEGMQQAILGNKETDWNRTPLLIKSLLRKTAKKVLQNIYLKDPQDILNERDVYDLPSFILPSSKNIPMTITSISFRKNIVDLAKDISPKHPNKVLRWTNTSTGAKALYVFSKPILDIVLTTFPSPIFISRGANAYHLLDTLICQYSDLLALAKNTFEATRSAEVNKTFTIKKFKSIGEHLENVVIHYSPSESFVIFKKRGEAQFTKWSFEKKKNTYKWNLSNEIKLPSLEAEEIIFTALNKSQPSKALFQITTGGQCSNKHFFETLCQTFWNPISPAIKLFTTLSSKEIFEKKAFIKDSPHQTFTEFELALDEVLRIPEFEIRKETLSKAFKLAKRVGYGGPEIIRASQNPLMKAVERNQYSLIQDFIKNHPEWIYETDCQGKTVLNMLLENEEKSILLTLFYQSSIWQGEAGYWALEYATHHMDEEPNEKVKQELVALKAGTKFQPV